MTGQQWSQLPQKQTGPMTEPVQFESKYRSKCPVCRNRIQVGERVNGIKLDTGKWAVWHTALACDSRARERFVGKVVFDEVFPQSATQPGIDPLLAAFEEEAKGI